jgi:hypothetical protein
MKTQVSLFVLVPYRKISCFFQRNFSVRHLSCSSGLALLWGLMALISLNHLSSFSEILHLSTVNLGRLAWITFFLSIGLLGHRFWRELLLLFLLFFWAGWSAGPFLEPPADPLDHLISSYATCGKSSVDIPKSNEGLWHYSMVGNILCHERYALSPEDVLNRIDITNGLFWGLSASVLFIVGCRAGLSTGWSFISVCIAFLFMGTNRFSYFSYYSFAPSLSSMWIYWLWIAQFFFKSQWRSVLSGLMATGVCFPILMVNHIQEAIFLLLITGIWVVYLLIRSVAFFFSQQHPLRGDYRWWLFIAALFLFFFVLPQWSVFQDGLRHLFFYDNWLAHQGAVFSWQGLHLIGKIWTYRVQDTLGLLGFLPIFLLPFFNFPKIIGYDYAHNWLILLLGLVPFCVYCIPLVNFVWTSNCAILDVYFRICYSSLFWLPIALVLSNLGGRLSAWLSWPSVSKKRMWNSLFLSFCFLLFIVLGSVQSGPIYGKLDFIAVNSRSWWDAWRPMIEKVVSWKKGCVETDYITGYVLEAIFNVPLGHKTQDSLSFDQIPRRTIETMVSNSLDDRVGCLINLHTFQPTWVPQTTGHWSSKLSNPALFYRVEDKEVGSVSNYLKKEALGKCYIYL